MIFILLIQFFLLFELNREINRPRRTSEEHTHVRIAFADESSQTAAAAAATADAQPGLEEWDEFNGRTDVVIEKAMKAHQQKKRVKGVDISGRISAKDFKSTQQGVLDPATTLIIFKMLQNGTLSECDTAVTIKTGKEASVFFGTPDFGSDKNAEVDAEKFPDGCAVKIFRTTLNEFANRSDYYDGDHRFGKFNKIGSTRDAIAKWAEKEYRNLMRVNNRSKLLAPEALCFKEHVVVMSFIGSSDGVPAPQLREVAKASVPPAQWLAAYLDTLTIVYSLYHDCKLVHGDLSEYNLLLHNSDVWVIDFGQAVDTSHPEHIAFMLRDIETVNTFFQKCGVTVLNAEAALTLLLQPLKCLDEALSQDRTTAAVDDSGSADIHDMIVRRIILQYVD
jgi:serine/threonine-protein kinase RIO1